MKQTVTIERKFAPFGESQQQIVSEDFTYDRQLTIAEVYETQRYNPNIIRAVAADGTTVSYQGTIYYEDGWYWFYGGDGYKHERLSGIELAYVLLDE